MSYLEIVGLIVLVWFLLMTVISCVGRQFTRQIEARSAASAQMLRLVREHNAAQLAGGLDGDVDDVIKNFFDAKDDGGQGGSR